jgi:hypothetical protein
LIATLFPYTTLFRFALLLAYDRPPLGPRLFDLSLLNSEDGAAASDE